MENEELRMKNGELIFNSPLSIIKYEKAHRQHAHDTAEELRKAYNGFIYDLTADITAEEWTEDDYLPLRKAPRFEARYKAKEKAFVKRLLSIYLGAMAVASLRAERKNAALIKNYELRINNEAKTQTAIINSSLSIINSPKRLATAKVGGLSLSERVWKNSKQTRAMIEASLNVGIKQGMSREAMARSIIKHLQHPDTLHALVGKRYRGKVPMQVLQHFHPGQGVYRDPYKNAYRLAISEVNNAYRRRDYELGQQNPLLIGWKIQRSKGRRHTSCKLCETLEGVYPKSFLFQGWHPACLCFAIQVLADDPKAVKPIEEFPKNYQVREQYKEYQGKDPREYEKVFFDKDSGGYLVINKNRMAKANISKNELAKFEKEKTMASVYARNGYRIELWDEQARISSPDGSVNGVPMDLKSLNSHNNIMRHARNAIKKQGAEVVLFEFTKETQEIYDVLQELKRKSYKVYYYFSEKEKVFKNF